MSSVSFLFFNYYINKNNEKKKNRRRRTLVPGTGIIPGIIPGTVTTGTGKKISYNQNPSSLKI